MNNPYGTTNHTSAGSETLGEGRGCQDLHKTRFPQNLEKDLWGVGPLADSPTHANSVAPNAMSAVS